ncbi:MAG: hypothetical protein PHC64_04090 [Candidatus Gastranaerophilales bacterium]|nr:hypothetical protein [Candidatus Gastranaerophilales bacterium]
MQVNRIGSNYKNSSPAFGNSAKQAKSIPVEELRRVVHNLQMLTEVARLCGH